MSEAPAFLQLQNLTPEEETTRAKLLSQLSRARRANLRQEAYYEGARRVRDLGISIPPHLRDVEAVAAGPQIVVDVVDERMDWRGWSTSGVELDLGTVYNENHLEIEVGQATLDSLICGLSYLTAGTGDEDEPEVLVKAESPNRMTATWDPRKRRAIDGLSEMYDSLNRLTGWQLYMPGETITAERVRGGIKVVDRDQHGYDRVPIAALINKPRASRMGGRSEITRHIRSITDSHMRTLLGMEIAREFYGAPQRYLMGADESMFMDEDGNPIGQWAALIGRMLMAPRDEDENLPQAGEFSASSPQPFTELLKTYMQEISASSGIPATHFGFATDNPASADAIQRADVRLDKRAVRRQKIYNLGLIELGEIVCLWRDGELPPPGSIKSLWTPVALVAPGAAADRASKMIAAGVLDPTWDFTLEQFGLDDDEIDRVRQERRKAAGTSILDRLRGAATEPLPAELDAREIKAKADAMGVLIRSGVSAESAAAQVGLTDVQFTGAVPVSLRLPESDATSLEKS